MARSCRGINNPYIVRVRVPGQDSQGNRKWTTISLDPALVTAAKVLYGDDLWAEIKGIAESFQHPKKSLSRVVSAEIVKRLVAAAGHDPQAFENELEILEARFSEGGE